MDFVEAAAALDTPEARATIETAEAGAHRHVRERLVYHYGGPSYVRDQAMAARGSSEALERLDRHGKQMDAIPKAEFRSVPGTEFEERVNPNLEVGHGGEFAPPLWLNELFAAAPRPGEVIQRLARTFDLPSGVSSVNLPRMTVGTSAQAQAPGGPVAQGDVETAKVKAPAIVFAGISDWAIQDLEQSPPGAHLDFVVFSDLTEAVDSQVEAECITGRGEAHNEIEGLLNIAEINAVSAGSAAVKEIYEALGKAMAQVGKNRKRQPKAWLMSTSKLAYLALAPESEQRPLLLTDQVGAEWPIVSLAGVGVYLDDAITRTWNTNQEPIFCVRSDDFLIWRSAPVGMVMADVLSGTLQVRFQMRRTVAAMLGRYPSGISAITGAGTEPPSGY